MKPLATLTVVALLGATMVHAEQPGGAPQSPVPGPAPSQVQGSIQTPVSDKPPASTVSPLVVIGGPAPRLVASFPKDGATVSAGVVVVSLEFDQVMSETESALATSPESRADPAPPCLSQPRRLADGKTYVFLCGAAPGKTYVLDLAAGSRVVNAAGRPIVPVKLRFSTNATIVDNLTDALEEAGLTSDDDPIMTSQEVNSRVEATPNPSPPSGPAMSGPVKPPLDSPFPHS